MNETIKEKQVQDLECLKRYELTSELCPLVDVGTYDTILSPSNWDDDALYNLEEDHSKAAKTFACLDGFDWEGYKGMLTRVSQDIIDTYAMPILRKYGVEAIKAVKVWSPMEYNFQNDQLYFDVYVADNFREIFDVCMKEFAEDEKLNDYIRKHYRSCSGFISFMPQSMREIAEFDDEVRCLACYLTFALLVEDYWSWFTDHDSQCEVYELISCNECPTDFCHAYLYCSDEWAKLYNNDVELNNLIWGVYYKIGRPWERHEMKDVCDFCGHIETEADRFIVWATDMGYSPDDLREMVG